MTCMFYLEEPIHTSLRLVERHCRKVEMWGEAILAAGKCRF
jgi:hypothetical protein